MYVENKYEHLIFKIKTLLKNTKKLLGTYVLLNNCPGL